MFCLAIYKKKKKKSNGLLEICKNKWLFQEAKPANSENVELEPLNFSVFFP